MATKIKLLPEGVANQIAAGEVVDRPASIVKELVENSLDAGARRVSVEVEQGGKRLVRVMDDGEGMSRDDALLALERHATSKIRTARDLFSIHTMGFRGEALPSIASVSETVMVTRHKELDSGVEVHVQAGTIRSVEETGAPPGTQVEIRRLFYNVPARKKFMKSVDTEMGHINNQVANMALARPDVHFTLVHNQRTVFDLPSSSELSGRLRHALGADAVANLVRVDRLFEKAVSPGEAHIHGFVSMPSYTRSNTRSLHLFVNRRFVRDRLINHAVFEAYRPLLPKGRYPLVVLFIDLPPEAVDVNVHPAKHEIRFREQNQVHQCIVETLQEVLQEADRTGRTAAVPEKVLYPNTGQDRMGENGPGSREQERVRAGEDTPLLQGVGNALRRYYEKADKEDGRDLPGSARAGTGVRQGPASAAEAHPSPADEDREMESATQTAALKFSELRVIGQAGGTYILAESRDSLVIIDQHAAHEKIMYERLHQEWSTEAVLKQSLLFPETVELNFQEARRVEDNLTVLDRLGLEVEPFGGNTVVIKALPALVGSADPRGLLLEVADLLDESDAGSIISRRLDDIFAVMACHSVVRAHKSMSKDEMEALLQDMDTIAYPGHCPHGRDVVVRINWSQLGKWFGR
ncbi:MAG: DNA mismatch repair endonuclease MutL [bacterium]